MPSTSVAMRRAMAVAEHHPEKLYSRNRGLLGMSKGQLHDFASTSEKGLSKKKKKDGDFWGNRTNKKTSWNFA